MSRKYHVGPMELTREGGLWTATMKFSGPEVDGEVAGRKPAEDFMVALQDTLKAAVELGLELDANELDIRFPFDVENFEEMATRLAEGVKGKITNHVVVKGVP